MKRIRYMNIPDKEREQVKEWKKIPKKTRLYFCPFHISEFGGKICAKAFVKCVSNPNKKMREYYELYEIYKGSMCKTDPCPCNIYTLSYVMIQANRIIKYGRI